MKKREISFKRREELHGFLFISPWLLGFFFVFLVPTILSIVFSFSTLDIKESGYSLKFCGLENYKNSFLVDVTFPKALAASLLDLVYNIPVILVFSFFVALLLKKKFRFAGMVKGIYFLPVIMSSGLFVLLQTNFGHATTSTLDAAIQDASASLAVLKSINLEKYLIEIGIPNNWITFISSPVDRIYSVILSSSVQIFIFLAGLNSISPSLYEAAHVEGGTAWENFWKITFPMMMPLLLVNVIYCIVDSFTSVSNGVMQYVYTKAFTEMNFGLSGAMSWLYFLILASVMAAVAGFMSRRIFYYT